MEQEFRAREHSLYLRFLSSEDQANIDKTSRNGSSVKATYRNYPSG